jgi:hypothetical protein
MNSQAGKLLVVESDDRLRDYIVTLLSDAGYEVSTLHLNTQLAAWLERGWSDAYFCLGTDTGAVSDAELRIITVEYTIEFARVFRSSSPDAAFSFLSGNGADPTGRNRLAFAR